MSSYKKMIEALSVIRAKLSEIECMTAPPHMKGYTFEKEFITECRARGLEAYKVNNGGHVDAVVCGKRVQCKHVSPNDCGIVYIAPGNGSWYVTNDFDVLAMRSDDSTYIVPITELPLSNGHLRIGIRPSAFSSWIDAWDVFEGGTPRAKARSLFDGLEDEEEIAP